MTAPNDLPGQKKLPQYGIGRLANKLSASATLPGRCSLT